MGTAKPRQSREAQSKDFRAGGERSGHQRWERAIVLARSKGEQLSDWIACTAGSGPVLILHVGCSVSG